jgi:hypothetical protein
MFGKFIGTVKAEWIDPDRNMSLLDDFIYVDPDERQWLAPKGAIINGASIPRIFWSIIGSPFTGEYRNASVVHDVACRSPYPAAWQAVHRMFYWACRCGGVHQKRAKIMYAAVYHFGPRWVFDKESLAALELLRRRASETHENFKRLEAFIESTDPELQAVDDFPLSEDIPSGN